MYYYSLETQNSCNVAQMEVMHMTSYDKGMLAG